MKVAAGKRVADAVVWKAGQRVARLRRSGAGVEFRYEPGYAGPPVALSLPLEVGVVQTVGGALPPFFAGLLPEGRRLAAIRRAAKTSADDDLTLLLAVGTDTIGDVQVTPEQAAAPARDAAPTSAAPTLAQASFAEIYQRVLSTDPDDRVGLPGAQDKVTGRMISLPVTHAGHAFILKLDPPEFPHLVANEAFFLAAARASGLEVAEAEVVHDRTGQAGLLVRRFDRESAAGELRALAQEDACQVLGRYPADKYRVTTEEVIAGLMRHAGAPLVAARALLQQFAFAYLTGNGDAHAKNFSLGERAGEWRVTPAYDVPCTLLYDDTTLALSVNGKEREDLGRKDFLALGDAVGLPPKAVTRVLDGLLTAMPAWHARLGELPFDQRRVHKLAKALAYRAKRLRG